jgi:hypothetical protein
MADIPKQKVSKRRKKAVVKELELLTHPKSTEEDKIRKLNKKIDDEVSERISTVRRMKRHPPKTVKIENQDKDISNDRS